MRDLKFDIYIGSKIIAGQADNIVAIVYPKFFIPHGQYRSNGMEKENGIECFARIYDLGTYIADWIDFAENENNISATIYLNIHSLKKVFCGKEIISIINRIDHNDNYKFIRDFAELD